MLLSGGVDRANKKSLFIRKTPQSSQQPDTTGNERRYLSGSGQLGHWEAQLIRLSQSVSSRRKFVLFFERHGGHACSSA
jgi:hypothetical protein